MNHKKMYINTAEWGFWKNTFFKLVKREVEKCNKVNIIISVLHLQKVQTLVREKAIMIPPHQAKRNSGDQSHSILLVWCFHACTFSNTCSYQPFPVAHTFLHHFQQTSLFYSAVWKSCSWVHYFICCHTFLILDYYQSLAIQHIFSTEATSAVQMWVRAYNGFNHFISKKLKTPVMPQKCRSSKSPGPTVMLIWICVPMPKGKLPNSSLLIPCWTNWQCSTDNP